MEKENKFLFWYTLHTSFL